MARTAYNRPIVTSKHDTGTVVDDVGNPLAWRSLDMEKTTKHCLLELKIDKFVYAGCSCGAVRHVQHVASLLPHTARRCIALHRMRCECTFRLNHPQNNGELCTYKPEERHAQCVHSETEVAEDVQQGVASRLHFDLLAFGSRESLEVRQHAPVVDLLRLDAPVASDRLCRRRRRRLLRRSHHNLEASRGENGAGQGDVVQLGCPANHAFCLVDTVVSVQPDDRLRQYPAQTSPTSQTLPESPQWWLYRSI